jgi:hypothetical protein
VAFSKEEAETEIEHCDRISIVSPATKNKPVEIVLKHFENGSSQRLRAAKLVAGRLQLPNPPGSSTRAFVGEAGIAIVVNEEQIEFFAFDGDKDWFVITRSQFKAWEHTNSRHLHASFRKPDERERRWKYQTGELLREFLKSWKRVGREKQWGANPLGLLQGLAAESSPTAVE